MKQCEYVHGFSLVFGVKIPKLYRTNHFSFLILHFQLIKVCFNQGHGFFAILDVEFGKNSHQMISHGARLDIQLRRNFWIGKSFDEQCDDLLFGMGQVVCLKKSGLRDCARTSFFVGKKPPAWWQCGLAY